MSGFADAIGLDACWPIEIKCQDEMSVTGLVHHARNFFDAGEILHCSERFQEFRFYSGPVMQVVGQSAELTLKAMLRGNGASLKDVRKHSHNTYQAYFNARSAFDEVKFINLHFSNTAHLSVPEEVRARLTLEGEPNIETTWRIYFDHLRLLDTVYDRPFRSRYAVPGPICLPDTEIVMIGTKILLSAMEDRLANGKAISHTP
jgi:hypothetical protein